MNTNTIADQIEIEELFDKNQALTRIRDYYKTYDNQAILRYLVEIEMDQAMGLAILTQMALHKRTTPSVIIGILYSQFGTKGITPQQCADTLEKAVIAQMVHYDMDKNILIVAKDIPTEIQHQIDLFQYPLPMIVKPKSVRKNMDNGYHLTTGSIILRKNHHDNDVCLDHINRVNNIRMCINFTTANMIKNKWKNLDKQKAGETKSDFDKRVKAFAKYDKTARAIMSLMDSKGNSFYLTHKYDKRGRIYAQGYHINYQGTEWNKAVIELADKEIVI